MEKEQFSAVRKDENGKIQMFQTSSGRELSYEEAIQEVDEERIENVSVVREKDGETYIRSNPDNRKDNNLDGLPIF
ncbi:DUF3892 domain-containing protein [Pseudalkalibacillus berkeleyi]|uniref:DUF3892 domain-containing protein n=1 Tax=Pseudalkalibacillus berkeleyi TaxID=1069813 RepID=A0ABS9GXK1_9BACL|nr:DUF3892 domain-containing protein [Pseudalkalibacillus berkeleyi]MCF6137502.1 DUF3892 domain-containing protein [Pseudalkalibacillus berkeleyi]